ncbi:MAG: hypothetical protein ACE5FD_14790, partial [Anaerolineae bacterium]
MAGSGSSPYKYSCRKCPIRARCIEESDNSPIIKASIRNAFQNKTDTVELWAHLQVNCLLEKADREVKAAGRESLLSKRLRLTREAKQAGEAATPLPPPAPPTKELPPAPPGPQPPRPKLTPQTSFRAYPAQPPTEIRDPGQVTPQEISESRARGRKFWLTIRRSGRHILLPNDGELVLGRFDPNFGVPPDVDLTFEDSPGQSVSRRHGRIEGRG